MVKFCPQCSNIFSHRINEDTSRLTYICLSCGRTEDVIDHCIVINELNTKIQDYPLNANMIYDQTLLRTQKIPCPNPECEHKVPNENGNPEIIIFQYNPTMLKTAYMCTVCQTYWKN